MLNWSFAKKKKFRTPDNEKASEILNLGLWLNVKISKFKLSRGTGKDFLFRFAKVKKKV